MTKVWPQLRPAWRRDLGPGEFISDGIWEDPAGRWRYELRFELLDSRMQCVKIQLHAPTGAGLTSADLRRFPIGRLFGEARVRMVAAEKWVAETVPDKRDEALAQVKAWEASQAGRPGPKGLGGSHFAEVAELYRREAALGRKPTKAVSTHYQVSKSAAAKWVARARTMGLLPPARKGKPG